LTIDTLRAVPTPEGIELTLKVAGPIARARAWAIDFFIRLVILIGFSTVAAALGRVGSGLTILFYFVLEWGYPVLFEVLSDGSTPGKKTCDLRVLHEDGTPVGWRASVARNLLRAVDFLPLFYGFGLIAMLTNRDFKRLGDMAAGTIVVHTEPKRARKPIPAADPTAPVVPLTLAEQRAVVDFAERRSTWSDERANELAAHAAPAWENQSSGTRAGGRDVSVAAGRLMQVASYLVGRRVAADAPPGRPDRRDSTPPERAP
jgi:uncharacterized RDD family membrane protein YckC